MLRTETYYSKEPEKILYMPLPTGEADVWLRENIREVEVTQEEYDTETGIVKSVTSTQWVAGEAYLRTSLSREEIEASFQEIINKEEPKSLTIPERLDIIEKKRLEELENLADMAYVNSEIALAMIEGMGV